jgi:hypothetical protein
MRFGAGWSSPVARQAHNLKVVGSNPTPATNLNAYNIRSFQKLSFWAAFEPRVRVASLSPPDQISVLASEGLRRSRLTERGGGPPHVPRREGSSRNAFVSVKSSESKPSVNHPQAGVILHSASYALGICRSRYEPIEPRSRCASSTSGNSGVGEKPSNAGARTACASAVRPVD